MKAAMDWKSHDREAKGIDASGKFDWDTDQEKSSHLTIGHFHEAFHGRSGYTLSVTNTDPNKTARFAKFDWPRFDNPKVRFPVDGAENARLDACEGAALDSIRAHAEANPDTMAAIIMEPIQGEGGDNHFRDSFLRDMRSVCDEVGALYIFDEVQTGMGATGMMWAHQHAGVEPDMIAFGKKSQVCGLMAGPRLKEFDDNVFETSGRINSTWGGNLTDFVRARLILETIERDDLVRNAKVVGAELVAGLEELGASNEMVSNVRGRGLFAAFTLPSQEIRDRFNSACLEAGMHVMNSGTQSIRLRPNLTFSSEEVNEGLNILESVANGIESKAVA
ncbi:MAG TPA: L-lysine 6-transaminase, partial [Candidatus Poseidoniales archaeon]|nr:L-lysine 6-transaminase [Candidatus Poseidoniales archaeon]